MGGAVGKITKVIKKVDPLRGGDKILEAVGLPSFTGEGDKGLFGAGGEVQGGNQVLTTAAGPETTDEARESAERSGNLRKRRGRAATILTSKGGDTSTVNVGTKTLLGS